MNETNKIMNDNIEEIMKEGKTVYSDHGDIIFRMHVLFC
jgi:hypothetical protein